MPHIDAQLVIEGLIMLILSITVHEFGHAIVADRLGDRLPRYQGRVSLNPLVHADPIGTLLIPVVGLLSGGMMFGWGRPVQVSPGSFTRKLRMRTAHLIVAAAGPAMNILFGITIALILFGLYRFGGLEVNPYGLYGALAKAIMLNFVLAVFNLLPCPPLDGGTVLAGLLPDRYLPAYERFAKYGIFILLAFMFIGPLQRAFLLPAGLAYSAVTGLLGLPH